MKPGGYSCSDITENASDHIDREQSWTDWLRFRVHIMMCSDCRAYLRQMEATVATLTAMPGEPLPDEVGDELMRRYREWNSKDE